MISFTAGPLMAHAGAEKKEMTGGAHFVYNLDFLLSLNVAWER